MVTHPFRFGPGICCCPSGPCWEFLDDFKRDDSTDLGSNWSESVGNWEILSNTLHEKAGGGGTANALVFCTQPVPADSGGEMRVELKALSATSGDSFSVFVCCTSSSSVGTATEITFEFLGVDQWRTTIVGTGAEGTATQTSGNGSTADLWICVDYEKQMISAGIICIDEVYAWVDSYDPNQGRYVALGHDNATTGATFDNFEMYNLRSSTYDRCKTCWCQCLSKPIKRTLSITMEEVELISGTHAFLEPMQGFVWSPLEWDFNGGFPQWHAAADADADYPWSEFDFTLKCQYNWFFSPGDPGKNISLAWDYEPIGVAPDSDRSTCEPLELWFGPFQVGHIHDPPDVPPVTPCVEEYWLVVREV